MRLPYFPLLTAGLLGLGAAACRTTSDEPSPAASAPTSQEPGEDALEEPDCPPSGIVCGQEDEPAYCTAATHGGRALPESWIVRAWGANACAGRVALARTACAKGLRPKLLGLSQCVPDASGGHCPPDSVACGPEIEPVFCAASRYGAQQLSAEQVVQAWGTNLCRAREALAMQACRQNLDPTALGDVACGPDPQSAECPPEELPCEDTPIEARCEVVRLLAKDLTQPLEAKADSACEAKQRLMRLVCRRGLKLSDVEDVVCRFGSAVPQENKLR